MTILLLTVNWEEIVQRLKQNMLASVCLASLISVMTMGMQNPRPAAAQQLSFEVASVKKSTIDQDRTSVNDLRTVGVQFLPGGRFYAKAPLAVLLLEAFKGRVIQAGSGPNQRDRALERDYWEIQAVAEKSAIPPGSTARARDAKMRLMLQALLADRFKMMIHTALRRIPVYALVRDKNGPHLQKSASGEKACADRPTIQTHVSGVATCHAFGLPTGMIAGFHGQAVDMADLAAELSSYVDRAVIDRTGLKDLYDITTTGWSVATSLDASNRPTASGTALSLFDVVEQLGLKLQPQNAVIDVIVIDHIELEAVAN
jgi:uncharacterized protein (TIGR03435 family)